MTCTKCGGSINCGESPTGLCDYCEQMVEPNTDEH